MRLGFIFVVLFVAACSARAINTIELVSGDARSLKGQTSVRVEFTYAEALRVGEMSEVDYVRDKQREYNAKASGTGDAWVAEWKSVRTNKCQPNFEKAANEAFRKGKVPLRLSAEAKECKYKMRVHVSALSPGWSNKLVGQSATVTGEVTICEAAAPEVVVCRLKVDRLVGAMEKDGLSLHVPNRLADAFQGSGRTVAKFLLKNGLK
jgi:hypothetical protein